MLLPPGVETDGVLDRSLTRASSAGHSQRAHALGARSESLWELLRGDYRRHGNSLRSLTFWAMATYRFGNWADTWPQPLRYLGGKLFGLLMLWIEITTGIVLHREVRLGKDFHLVHSGNIKIHPGAVIGDRVGIMHDVTIGTTPERDGAPRLGNDVFIGAGAKILGPVVIGDRARVAANSLVISDIPEDSTAIGVPAKVLKYTGRRGPLESAS